MTTLIFLIAITLVLTACDSKPEAMQPASVQMTKGSMAVQDEEIDLFKISDRVFDKYFRSGYGSLSKPEKVFVCVWGLEGEVNNGGFDQYYFNSAGNHALDTPEALVTIGAHKTADIVKEANAVFGDEGPSADRKRRQRQLDALSEKAYMTLDTLDDRFYEYPDDLEFLLKEYVGKNREAFSIYPKAYIHSLVGNRLGT